MATIILTGGGTAGHCIPNVALLPYIKKYFDKIYYIGSENGLEKQIITKIKIPYFSIPCAKLDRDKKLKNFAIPFKVASGIHHAGKILDKIKPDVIFSKGGYVAVPTVLAAKKRNIPVISHESDYTIGLANKITSKYCKIVLTSFQETANTIKNGQFVGPPLKALNGSKTKALNDFGLSGTKPVVLVTGGSLGAKAINTALIDALPSLLDKFDVLHVCGKNNVQKKNLPTGYVQKEFIDDMKNAYAIADVCVSRSGSNTVFELLCLKKPCVLIPLPKGASRGDQELNAEYFQKKGAVNVLHQSALTAQSLTTAIESTYHNKNGLIENINKLSIKNSCKEIADILIYYANSPLKNK